MIISQQKIQEVKNRFEIVGSSPLLHQAIEKALKVSPTDISVLISGESGVGKENFSKIIHHLSHRKHGPFIAINCAAIPEGTIDSELFGHEKGSFTSAYEARKGYFETVNSGTIFLDEISELPFETQSRLLRVLETGEFIKVGSSKVLKTDIRMVAASNKDLYDLTQKNKFREDLFYRLSTVNIKVPPLRKRKEDIYFLFAKFSNDFADKYKTPPLELADDGLDILKAYPWPGNIRQLKNLIEQISILETERIITAEILKKYLQEIPGRELIAIEPVKDAADSITEREILFKFLLDIKKDVSETKNYIYDILGAGRTSSADTMKFTPGKFLKPNDPPITESPLFENTDEYDEISEPEFITSESAAVPETFSLQEKEKELIKSALIKHKGKRKTAAAELGISERTLYRKIKEYGLDNL